MLKRLIYYILLCFFLIIFIYSCINISIQNNDLNKRIKLDKIYSNINGDSYRYLNIIDVYKSQYNNDDIVGILNIDSLDISSLIVKGKDNNYYLNHLENKDKSIYGSLMLDYRTDINDKINIIYGHSSDNNFTPFSKLFNYLNYDFYKDNKYLEVIGDSTYNYKIFSVSLVDKNEYRHLIINSNNYLEQLNWFKDISIYKEDISFNSSDKILILQTCYKDKFLLVVALKS